MTFPAKGINSRRWAGSRCSYKRLWQSSAYIALTVRRRSTVKKSGRYLTPQVQDPNQAMGDVLPEDACVIATRITRVCARSRDRA
jgi:hypothetical protein